MTLHPHSAVRTAAAAGAALAIGLSAAPALAQALPPVSPAPVVQLEYDAQGNSTRTIQGPSAPGLDLTTSHSYDRLHRKRSTTDARSGVTRLDYNGRDDITQVADPRNLLTQYPRNGLGDSTGLISPDTGAASHTYDAAGNLKTRQDSRGALATHSYDALNRLTATTYTLAGQPAQVFTWAYDQTGAGFGHGIGRLTSTSYPGGGTTHAYDAQGRLTGSTQLVLNSAGATLALSTGYGYDPAGRIVSITYPSGRVLFIPHSGGLPSSMSLAPSAGASALPLISALQFQAQPGGAGPARSWVFHLASGTSANDWLFDAWGRPVRYPLGGAVRDITYDAADRIVGYAHHDANTGSALPALNQSFSYDELGRLTQVSSSTGHWSYAYDANGNRTSLNYAAAGQGGSTRGHSIEPTSNRLSSLNNPTRTFTHDAAGNTLRADDPRSGYAAIYDAAGRMARLDSFPDLANYHSTAYVHDANGQRVLKAPIEAWRCDHGVPCVRLPLGPVIYVYDLQGQLLGEYDGNSGSALREYIWLQGAPVAFIDGPPQTQAADPNAGVYYVQTDHLSTPRVVIDRQGRQRWTWVAEPFGNSTPIEDPVGFGPLTLNLRMPGQYWDRESGYSYNWMRTYDAGLGRFTQSDPIGLAGGINTYTYVGGNPLSYTDPTGEFALLLPAVPAVAGWVAGAAGAAAGAVLGWNVFGPMLARPPENAYDPNGPKAPGKPTEADGFKDPRGGENWVPNPNGGRGGSGYGWQDAKGDVWCPTGQGGRSHSGPHWDVQTPGGGYRNVKPRR